MNIFPLVKSMLILTLLGSLNGCAVMSKSDCLSADWQQVGRDVGFDGELDSSSAFNKRATICAKYGTAADQIAFQAGYEQGIDNYCEVSNAVILGTRGVRKALSGQVCPEPEYPGFTSAFNAGYKLFVLQNQVNQMRYEIDRLLDEQYRYQRRRQELRYQIQSGDLSDRERRNAEFNRRQIRRDIRHVNALIYRYQAQLVEHQTAVDTYSELLELEYSDGLY